MTPVLFRNADVVSLDPAAPPARAVLVDGAAIVDAGDERHMAARGARRVDCGGAALLPAFIDAHCHLLAAAAARRSVDCSPAAVRSVRDIQRALREAAARAREGGWIRAAGYDETALEERRHPTCRDLDAAVPHLPVRLLHRSGHAAVLNTAAMHAAGIGTGTPEPPGALIDRFLDSGEPNGLLIEMGDIIDRTVPPLPYGELASAVAEVARDFLAAGVTAICDATHTNGAAEMALFARLQSEGHLPLDVTLMESAAAAGGMPAAAGASLRRGHVKIMLSELGGGLAPGDAELARAVGELHRSGRDVAIHAVEERAVEAAIAAIEAALRGAPRPHRHRIEHAALPARHAERRLVASGITVVMQPSFLLDHGDRYLGDVAAPKHRRLYPIGELVRAGVRVAGSSDAPVARIGALEGMRASVERRTGSGKALAPAQAATPAQALAMWTREAAYACGLEAARGRIAPGMAADVVLVDRWPGARRVLATFICGELVYSSDARAPQL